MHGAHDGRYAPSPTGELHLGNLRTALAAWLFARSAGARFTLRIDDLDPDRSRPEHANRQLDDLRRLGIDWDGAPVLQSERLARYHEVLDGLLEADLAYPCFCTRAEVLAAASAPHGRGVEAPYPGTCARRAPSEARARIAAGEPHCIRARADGAVVAFDDALLGRVEETVDDFVVRRRDGVPAYNLASPIDEADLAIGEVVRGADLAPTTPRQLWVARVAGLHAPRFAHVPLVLGPDGARLAKRHGAAGLARFDELGVPTARVLEVLARSLGLAPPDPPADAGALVAGFDRTLVPDAPFVLDPGELTAGIDRALHAAPGGPR